MQRSLPPEEAARADFYALLARLLYDAPDAALLRDIADAQALPAEGDAALGHGLAGASSMRPRRWMRDAAAEEYEALFGAWARPRCRSTRATTRARPPSDHPRVRIQRRPRGAGPRPARRATRARGPFRRRSSMRCACWSPAAPGARPRTSPSSASSSSRTSKPAWRDVLRGRRRGDGGELLSHGRRAGRGVPAHRSRIVPAGLTPEAVHEKEA